MSVSAPVISPAPGVFFGSLQVSITCATPGASIYYTLDGSLPSAGSILYSGPFTITSGKVVNAIAVIAPSAIVTSAYATTGISSNSTWQAVALKNSQSNNYRVEFDAVPNTSAMDGVVGLASTVVNAYGGLSYGIRFHTDGMIGAMAGAAYTTGGPTYVVGGKYHFILDVSGQTYKASVVSPAGVTTVLGTSLPFRFAAATITNLNVVSEIGSLTVGSIVTSPLLVISATVSVTLNWLAPSDPVSGFNVYRGASSGQELNKLNTALITGTSFIDTVPVKGQDYYTVRPVILAPDGTPVEGQDSNEIIVPIN